MCFTLFEAIYVRDYGVGVCSAQVIQNRLRLSLTVRKSRFFCGRRMKEFQWWYLFVVATDLHTTVNTYTVIAFIIVRTMISANLVAAVTVRLTNLPWSIFSTGDLERGTNQGREYRANKLLDRPHLDCVTRKEHLQRQAR